MSSIAPPQSYREGAAYFGVSSVHKQYDLLGGGEEEKCSKGKTNLLIK